MYKVIDTRTGEDVTGYAFWMIDSDGALGVYSRETLGSPESITQCVDHYKVIFDKPKVKKLEWEPAHEFEAWGSLLPINKYLASTCYTYRISADGGCWITNTDDIHFWHSLKGANNFEEAKQLAQEHRNAEALRLLEIES